MHVFLVIFIDRWQRLRFSYSLSSVLSYICHNRAPYCTAIYIHLIWRYFIFSFVIFRCELHADIVIFCRINYAYIYVIINIMNYVFLIVESAPTHLGIKSATLEFYPMDCNIYVIFFEKKERRSFRKHISKSMIFLDCMKVFCRGYLTKPCIFPKSSFKQKLVCKFCIAETFRAFYLWKSVREIH